MDPQPWQLQVANKKSFVMAGTRIDFEHISDNLEYDAVCGIDTNAPPSSEIALERFWLADALVSVAFDALDKRVYAP